MNPLFRLLNLHGIFPGQKAVALFWGARLFANTLIHEANTDSLTCPGDVLNENFSLGIKLLL